jgi:hypothetical protein
MMLDDFQNISSDAHAAQSILDNDIFNKCFESMNEEILAQIVATPMEASSERERLYLMFKGGQLFVQQFAAKINENNRVLQIQPDVE